MLRFPQSKSLFHLDARIVNLIGGHRAGKKRSSAQVNDSEGGDNSFFVKRPRRDKEARINTAHSAVTANEDVMVIDDSDLEMESANESSPSKEPVEISGRNHVAINLAYEPKPSFLGTDARRPSRQATLTDLNWVRKETQQEKEGRWARESKQMEDERQGSEVTRGEGEAG